MSDYNISNMNMKQLRNEVQALRDELAIFKRKYEDVIYNLDTDNFSGRFIKEQDNMKTSIEVTAKGIKSMVSKEEMESFKESTISQTAEQIKIEVSKVNTATDDKLKSYATTEWTTNAITSTVSETYITDKIGDKYVSDDTFEQYKVNASSEIQATANGIYVTVMEEVSGEYETKNDAERVYGSLETSISDVYVTANGVRSKVEKVSKGKYEYTDGEVTKTATLFEQSADKFYFDGWKTIFTGAIALTDNDKNEKATLSHDQTNPAKPFVELYSFAAPLILNGSSYGVYIGSANTDDTLVATHKWVLENAGGSGGVATFG